MYSIKITIMSQLNSLFRVIPGSYENQDTHGNDAIKSHVLSLLSTDSFHIKINDIDRQKFSTDELNWNWSLALYITPISPVVESESESESIQEISPLRITYSFQKNNFTKGYRYWPNDRYDIKVTFEHPGFSINEHLQKHIQSFIENLIRSEHKDTNGD